MIKDAFSSVPAKPALVIAPLLVVLVLSLYYRDQFNKCVEIRDTRAAFSDWLKQVDASVPVQLAEFTDFDWTRVRIVARVGSDTISETCPLDWNWKSGERQALLDSGNLTAMVFALQGRIVRYVELNALEVEFRNAEGNLAPQLAVFQLQPKSTDGAGVILTRVGE